MTRMTRTSIGCAGLVACLVFGSGCGPDPKQVKIDELTMENDQLRREMDDRDRRLNDAMVREGDSASTIDELNQRLAKLRADADKMQGADGWITMPSFDMISVPGEILFRSGKADLTPEGVRKISEMASDIRGRYGDRDIYVFGNTDDDPIRKSKWKDNWELGAHRSLNVIRALQSHGVAGESLVQANCGQYRPRDSNSSATGKRQNRRVEFYAVKRNTGVIESAAAFKAGDE